MKVRALTEMVYVDEIDVDQEGIAEMMLDENAIAQVARKHNFYKCFKLLLRPQINISYRSLAQQEHLSSTLLFILSIQFVTHLSPDHL